MMLALTVIVIVADLLLYVWYGAIVTRRNQVSEALGGIDAQLQQRHDLIPNVVAIARRFMAHETVLLEGITTLRGKALPHISERDPARIGEKFRAESALGADLERIFALAENYPTLTSAGPMMEAQRTYVEIEANIAAARRFYNSAVGALRNAAEMFPGPLLARLAGVTTLPPFYETTAAERTPISAIDHL